MGPVAGIGVGIAWIGAETRIAAGGTIAVIVVVAAAVAVTTAAGDRTVVGVAAAGAITESIRSSFPFHILKS